MHFEFLPLRFEFLAHEPLYFPPGKASNILRGALGIISKRIACRPECNNARTCDARHTCPYALIFEPRPKNPLLVPSGLADWPRPFIFRARHLDHHHVCAGDLFYFDLHLFSLNPSILSHFILAFTEFARQGLGPNRARTELQRVRTIAAGNTPQQSIPWPLAAATQPVSLDLSPAAASPPAIRIDFLSPMELKHENKIAAQPDFPILFGRVRDRISTLRALYGPGPLDIDFRGIGERAAQVRMTRCEVHHQDAQRRSSRTGQTHSIGGFVGEAEYAGDLAEFLPYLQAACWTGIGRHSVWGKGEISISARTG